MGPSCCSAINIDKSELKVGREKTQVYNEGVESRKGLPSDQIAIKLSQIQQRIKSIQKIQQINKKVFKVHEYEKVFKHTLRVNKQPIVKNRIPQPYYIPSLDMFYIGEWIYNKQISENLPGGIGRLYQDGAVSQGVFQSYILNNQQIEAIKMQEEYPQNTVNKLITTIFNDHQNSQSYLQLSAYTQNNQQNNQIQRLLKADRARTFNDVKFIIKLNGSGRIVTKQQDTQEEIKAQGEFYKGILNGKGSLKITFKGQQIYSYEGNWNYGQRQGKGVQSFKTSKSTKNEVLKNGIISKSESSQNFKYQGNFHQNSKHGKGQITFIGVRKQQNLIDNDIQRMRVKYSIEGENMKIQAIRKVVIRQYKQKLIARKLRQDYKSSDRAQNIVFSQQGSLLLQSSFTMQRMYRTIFSQSYLGQFVHGKMEGNGTYVWTNGKIYRGKWKDNKMHGKGQFYWPDGSYFQGTYENDERTGEGIMIWNVNQRYRGSWAFGYRHGYGQSIQIDQKTLKMKVTGSIWDRDKVKKRLYLQVIDIPQIMNTQQVQKNLQLITNSVSINKRLEKKLLKDKIDEKADEQEGNILNYQSLKNLASETLQSRFFGSNQKQKKQAQTKVQNLKLV